MPKQPVIDAKEAERLLLKAGYIFTRSKGSHRIYMKEKTRMVIPFDAGKSLHPKIIRQVMDAIK